MEIPEKHGFMKKLPASELFTIETKYGRSSHEDFFGFLQNCDRASGRAKSEEFPYISFPPNQFKEMIPKFMEGAKTFIDVGCGGGDKLAIVKENWPHVIVHGVEHDPAMATWARTYGDEVFCEDALEMGYSFYDVIYAYWPIQDPVKMDQLIMQILRTKTESAKFVLMGFGYSQLPKSVNKYVHWNGRPLEA